MAALLMILTLVAPRLVIIYLYFFSTWFTGVFQTWYWPLLGFICMPLTMLWFSAVSNWFDGKWGILQFAVLAVLIFIDLGSGTAKRKKKE